MASDDDRGFTVVRAEAADADLALIFEHLLGAYVALGETPPEALDRAESRLAAIQTAMERLGRAPHQGTLCTDVAADLRRATKDGAIFYFEVDDAARTVTVLAVFFGGQDHVRRMLERLTA
jgi:plasmid stabilization system protein ParE